MVSAAIRGVFALITAVAIASPALAQVNMVSDWVRQMPQPSGLVLVLVAVAVFLLGMCVSRKRREP